MPTRTPINWPRMLHKTIVLTGGVNESHAAIEMKPGQLFQCKNYEELEGESRGYSSVAGTEVFDGRTSPSSIGITLLYDYGDDEYTHSLLESLISTDNYNKISTGPTFTFGSNVTWTTYRKKFGEGSWRFFNGSSGSILIDQTGGSFDLNSDFTIDGWFQHDATLSDCILFEKPNCIKVYVYNGKIYVDLSTNGGTSYNIQLVTTNSVLANRWRQVSITRVDDTLLLGVGGVIEDSYDLTALTVHTNTSAIKVGDGVNSNADMWCDSFRISNIARHGNEYAYDEDYEYTSDNYFVFNANDLDRETARAAIGTVTGEDSVLGVTYFNGKSYAARAITTGGNCGIYHSSTSGWTQDSVGYVTVNVDTSSIVDDLTTPVNGLAFTASPSGASGTVFDYVLETGDPSTTTGEGFMVLDVTSGTVATGDTITITTLSKTADVVSILSSNLNLPDQVKFVEGRFAYFPPDSPNSKSLFIFGVSTGFAALTSSGLAIYRGPSDVTAIPKFAKTFDNRLWLVYPNGHVFYSAAGDPTNFSGTFGGGEMFFGDEVTNLKITPGGNLVVIMDGSIEIVSKNEPSDATVDFPYWKKPFDDAQGAYPDTAASLLGDIYFCDERGITSLGRENDESDVQLKDVKKAAYKTYQLYRKNILGAYLHKEKSQYRVLFSISSSGITKGIYMTFGEKGLKGATLVEYPHVFTCFYFGYDSNGDPITLAGAEDGYVYKLDTGVSFNGEEIETSMQTAFYHYGTPKLWKRFYDVTYEITAPNRMAFYFQPNFNYGSPDMLTPVGGEVSTVGQGGIWGQSLWGSFIWGGAVISNPAVYLIGYGYNMSMSLRTSSKHHEKHIIHDMIVTYSNGNTVM